MALESTEEFNKPMSHKLDDPSDLDSGKSDVHSPLDSISSLDIHDQPPKWNDRASLPTQLDLEIDTVFDHGCIYHHDKVLENWTVDVDGTLVTVPVLEKVYPTLDASILELEPHSHSGYALLVFNIPRTNWQTGNPLDWILNDMPNQFFGFEDGSGFAKGCSSLEKLQHEAFAIEYVLKHVGVRPLDHNKSLKPLLVATTWKALDLACHKLHANLLDRTKDIAIAACMREIDWFVQAIPAWPVAAANRDILIPSLVDYLVVALGSIPVRDQYTSVLDLFSLVEVPCVSSNSTMVFLRLAPTFDGSDWATRAIAQKLVSDCLMYSNGWNWNSISHFLHPSCSEILQIMSVVEMPRPVEPGSLTEAFIARRFGKSRDGKVTSSLRRTSTGTALRTTTDNGVYSRSSRCVVEADLPADFQVTRRQFPRPNNIDVKRIYSGLDVRTTIMLRNLPNRLSHVDLYEHLAAACPGEFDFLYVRIDFSNGCNVGYGFVNMISPQSVIGFVESFRGFRWPGSEKIAEVSYATQQGREALINRFRNSSVMTQPETHRPKLYFPLGTPQAGLEEPFPKPDNLAKLHRSQQNADAEGLYETRGRRGVAAGRRRAGMLDPHHTQNGVDVHDHDQLFLASPTWTIQRGEYRNNGSQPYLPKRIGFSHLQELENGQSLTSPDTYQNNRQEGLHGHAHNNVRRIGMLHHA